MIHSFPHPFIHSFIHSHTHSLTYSFTRCDVTDLRAPPTSRVRHTNAGWTQIGLASRSLTWLCVGTICQTFWRPLGGSGLDEMFWQICDFIFEQLSVVSTLLLQAHKLCDSRCLPLHHHPCVVVLNQYGVSRCVRTAWMQLPLDVLNAVVSFVLALLCLFVVWCCFCCSVDCLLDCLLGLGLGLALAWPWPCLCSAFALSVCPPVL